MWQVGRKGSLPWVFETLFSLVLLALFSYGVFSYIGSHANGATYFSNFYASDLATSAQIAAAPAGNVVLGYDNIKTDLPLGFQFQNGKITVGQSLSAGAQAGLAVERYYGIAASYPTGDVVIQSPRYLSMQKTLSTFSISAAEQRVGACPNPTSMSSLKMAKVYVRIDGGLGDDTKIATDTITAIMPIKIVSEQEANLKIIITKKDGDTNTVAFGSTNDDGIAFDCIFKEQIGQVSGIAYSTNNPTRTSSTNNAAGTTSTIPSVSTIPITITTSSKVRDITAKQIGTAIVTTLATYFKGSPTNVATTPSTGTTTSPGTTSGSENVGSSAGCGVPGAQNVIENTGKVELIGDSITVGYSPLLKTCSAKNVGTYAQVGRFSGCMKNKANAALAQSPDVVIIMAGTNDIAGGGKNPTAVYNNIISIKDTAKQRNPTTRIFIMTIPPFGDYANWQTNKEYALKLNDMIRNGAGDYTVIDTYALLVDPNKDFYYAQGLGASDNLHPSGAGSRKIATAVANAAGCST